MRRALANIRHARADIKAGKHYGYRWCCRWYYGLEVLFRGPNSHQAMRRGAIRFARGGSHHVPCPWHMIADPTYRTWEEHSA